MPTIQRPIKTGGNRTYSAEVAGGFTKIKSAEVDGDIDLLYSTIHILDAANLADGAISTSKIQDGAVTRPKLNFNLVPAFQYLDTTPADPANGIEAILLTAASFTPITTSSTIVIDAIFHARFVLVPGTVATLEIRLKRNGVTIETSNTSTEIPGTAGAGNHIHPVTLHISLAETGIGIPSVYSLTTLAAFTSGGVGSNKAFLRVVEHA